MDGEEGGERIVIPALDADGNPIPGRYDYLIKKKVRVRVRRKKSRKPDSVVSDNIQVHKSHKPLEQLLASSFTVCSAIRPKSFRLDLTNQWNAQCSAC